MTEEEGMQLIAAHLGKPVSDLMPFELGPPASDCQHMPTPDLLREHDGEWTCPEDGTTFVLKQVKNVLRRAKS